VPGDAVAVLPVRFILEKAMADDTKESLLQKLRAKSDRPTKAREHDIATKRELDALEERERKPASSLDYRIDGNTERAVHEQVEQELNGRKTEIRGRLTALREKATKDFANAKNQDRAKHDFDRSK